MELHKIQKSGNSYYVTIPRSYLDYLGLIPKKYAMVILQEDCVKIAPVAVTPWQNRKEKKKKRGWFPKDVDVDNVPI